MIAIPNMRGALAPAGGGTDPLFSYVVFLSHMDGTMTDVKGHTITTSGSPSISSTQKKFGTDSLRIPDTSSSARVAEFAAARPGTGDFCLEFWLRMDGVSGQQTPVDFRTTSGGSTVGAWLFFTNAANMRVYNSTNTLRITTTGNLLQAATWQFHALDRYSGTTNYYIDGVSAGSWADSMNHNTAVPMSYGEATQTTSGCPGYLDEIRYTVGVSRYQGTNFTPPTAAFPDS